MFRHIKVLYTYYVKKGFINIYNEIIKNLVYLVK